MAEGTDGSAAQSFLSDQVAHTTCPIHHGAATEAMPAAAAASATRAVLLLAAAVALLAAPAAAGAKTVHVVFGNHLDIGAAFFRAAPR